MSRNEECFCGSGKKQKKCHSPVSVGSKLSDMYVKYYAYDNKIEQLKLSGKCPRNCFRCCSDYFSVSENEFLLVLDFLLRKGGQDLVDRYKKKADDYYQYMSLHFPEVTDELDKYVSDMESLEKSLLKFVDPNYFKSKQLKCIFLENYKCSIYEARPTICRTYGMCLSCNFINNREIHFKEEEDLASTQLIEGKRIIMKRPYPLFYYFSYFLNKDQYDGTMKKLSMIRSRSEKGYAEYTEIEMK